MDKLNLIEIENIINLPSPKRYEYFIKKSVGWDKVWGLYNEGWATVSDLDGNYCFPVWPASEYARLCAEKEWKSYLPKYIILEEFIRDYLSEFYNKSIKVAVFMTTRKKGIVVSAEEFIEHIRNELDKY